MKIKNILFFSIIFFSLHMPLQASSWVSSFFTDPKQETSDFFEAIKKNDFQTVHKILQTNKIVAASLYQGNNCLHFALDNHQPKKTAHQEENHLTEIIKIIIKHTSFDLEDKNSLGDTPLHIAAKNGYTEIVYELVIVSAKTETKNLLGNTPLHLAAENGHAETVNVLIAVGAKVETRNLSGDTPLWLAAKNGHAKTVANINTKNKSSANASSIFLIISIATILYDYLKNIDSIVCDQEDNKQDDIKQKTVLIQK